VRDLAEQSEHLAAREREVGERERSIGEIEAQVEERIAELQGLREEMERRIAAFEAQQGDRLPRLAKVYAAMPPERVAPLLQELELELAVSILARMKEKSSAAILAELPRGQAVLLTNRMARPLGGPPGGRR
jgi:flagellar motility protein MotE (MotC chaperone)